MKTAKLTIPQHLVGEFLHFMIAWSVGAGFGAILTGAGVKIPETVGNILAGAGTRLNSISIPSKLAWSRNERENDLQTLANFYHVNLEAQIQAEEDDLESQPVMTYREVFSSVLDDFDNANKEALYNTQQQITLNKVARLLNMTREDAQNLNNKSCGSKTTDIAIVISKNLLYIAVAGGVGYVLPIPATIAPIFDNLIRSVTGYGASRGVEIIVNNLPYLFGLVTDTAKSAFAHSYNFFSSLCDNDDPVRQPINDGGVSSYQTAFPSATV